MANYFSPRNKQKMSAVNSPRRSSSVRIFQTKKDTFKDRQRNIPSSPTRNSKVPFSLSLTSQPETLPPPYRSTDSPSADSSKEKIFLSQPERPQWVPTGETPLNNKIVYMELIQTNGKFVVVTPTPPSVTPTSPRRNISMDEPPSPAAVKSQQIPNGEITLFPRENNRTLSRTIGEMKERIAGISRGSMLFPLPPPLESENLLPPIEGDSISIAPLALDGTRKGKRKESVYSPRATLSSPRLNPVSPRVTPSVVGKRDTINSPSKTSPTAAKRNTVMSPQRSKSPTLPAPMRQGQRNSSTAYFPPPTRRAQQKSR